MVSVFGIGIQSEALKNPLPLKYSLEFTASVAILRRFQWDLFQHRGEIKQALGKLVLRHISPA